jgi:hypothetical protein
MTRDIPTPNPVELGNSQKISRREKKDFTAAEAQANRDVRFKDNMPDVPQAVFDDLNREDIFTAPELTDAESYYKIKAAGLTRGLKPHEQNLDKVAKLRGRTDFLQIRINSAKTSSPDFPVSTLDFKEYGKKLLEIFDSEDPENHTLQPQQQKKLTEAISILNNPEHPNQKEAQDIIFEIAKNLRDATQTKVHGGMDSVNNILTARYTEIAHLCQELANIKSESGNEQNNFTSDTIFRLRRKIRAEALALTGFAKNYAAYNREKRGLEVLAKLSETGFTLTSDDITVMRDEIQRDTILSEQQKKQYKDLLESLPVAG